MSDSDRRDNGPILGLTVVTFLIVSGLIGYYLGMDNGQRFRAEIQANIHHENTAQYIESTCVGLADPAQMSVCIKEAINTSGEYQRAEYDLKAQLQMSEWAKWLLVLTALTVGITAVGVWYVRDTLAETRKAVDAANKTIGVTKKIGKEQLRPWVSSYGVDGNPGMVRNLDGTISFSTYFVTVKWRNEGASPAIKCMFNNKIRITRVGEPIPIVDHSEELGIGVIGPSHESMGSAKPIENDVLIGLANRTHNVYLYGRVNYLDAIDGNVMRVSETCYKITIDGEETNNQGITFPRFLTEIAGDQNTAT